MPDSIGRGEGIWVPEELVCHAISFLPGDEEQNRQHIQTCGTPPDELIFTDDYSRLFYRKAFAFPVEYQGRSIRCVVAWETLVSRFGAKAADLKTAEATFLEKKECLRELAKALILEGKFTPENEVVIA